MEKIVDAINTEVKSIYYTLKDLCKNVQCNNISSIPSTINNAIEPHIKQIAEQIKDRFNVDIKIRLGSKPVSKLVYSEVSNNSVNDLYEMINKTPTIIDHILKRNEAKLIEDIKGFAKPYFENKLVVDTNTIKFKGTAPELNLIFNIRYIDKVKPELYTVSLIREILYLFALATNINNFYQNQLVLVDRIFDNPIISVDTVRTVFIESGIPVDNSAKILTSVSRLILNDTVPKMEQMKINYDTVRDLLVKIGVNIYDYNELIKYETSYNTSKHEFINAVLMSFITIIVTNILVLLISCILIVLASAHLATGYALIFFAFNYVIIMSVAMLTGLAILFAVGITFYNVSDLLSSYKKIRYIKKELIAVKRSAIQAYRRHEINNSKFVQIISSIENILDKIPNFIDVRKLRSVDEIIKELENNELYIIESKLKRS